MVQLKLDDFGSLKNEDGTTKLIKRFTWLNSNNVSVQVITYGGYITSIKVPDSQGKVDDIVIGFDSLQGYLQPGNAYFGATVGRFANRIAKGKMTIDGEDYQLAVNNNGNHLHGGVKGFDKVVWNHHVNGKKVVLSYLSIDGEENYPGDLLVNVTFELTETNEFLIDYKATTTRPTTVNLTNHSYFNLAGSGKGSGEIYKHVVQINASEITEVDETSIPTGKLFNVAGTVFDFQSPKVLGNVINNVPTTPTGFDHNFCINKCNKQGNNWVARVTHPTSGRTLEVFSNQPGVQFYTGNFLPEDDSLTGKGSFIKKHGAFCLETQNYPDAVNQKKFPNAILQPGETYHHTTAFKFSLQA